MRLITIPFSHYNEFARWALDRSGVEFREEAYMPLLHVVPVAVATRSVGTRAVDPWSSPFATPVLICDDGRSVRDSRHIARYVDERRRCQGPGIYELAETVALEQRFHEKLGPHTRRLAFYHLLSNRGLVRRLSRENVGPLQDAVFRAVRPLILLFLRRALKLTPEAAERSLTRTRREFEFADQLLATRPYLAGERFGAADMSFASMAAPALWVQRDEGYSGWLPPLEQLPEPSARLAHELRATRAGQHVLRMFRDERDAQ